MTMLDYIFLVIMLIILGSVATIFSIAAWSFFEETEIGGIVVEKIKSWIIKDEE